MNTSISTRDLSDGEVQRERDLPHVVIVGAGFGGLWTARNLRKAPVRITLLDSNNYHLFQPLLYQVATAGLAPSDIAWPVRNVLSRQRNATVLMDKATGIDTAAKEVLTANGRLPFDYLVLATGSEPAWFGHDEWKQYAPGLKSIDDATSIRRRILLAFEQAETTAEADLRQRLLTFIVIGGGPTGVELAGTIAELAQRALLRDFRRIDPSEARIVLVEAGPRVLSSFGQRSSDYALRELKALGIEVRLESSVTACTAEGITVGNEVIRSATVLWAAGVRATPVGQWLGVPVDRAGRVPVAPDLSVPGLPDVYVIGDAATLKTNDKPVPGVAPAAKQEGVYVAAQIQNRIRDISPSSPFVYRDYGNFATIGRKAAVIEFRRIAIRGYLAWWIWGLGHIYFLIGVRSPVIVALNWLLQYFTYSRGARLITGVSRENP